MANYQDQLNELVNIYIRSQNGGDDNFYKGIFNELRTLSNNWQDLQKNNLLTFPEYTQLIEKKYHLSESIQLRQ